MSEPTRLRDSSGPAGVLMGGAKVLRVPGAARRRALTFTGTAAGLAASTSVAAASTSLLKGFVVSVCLGAAGGGIMSLAASETVSLLQDPPPSASSVPVRQVQAKAPGLLPKAEPAPRVESLPEEVAPVPLELDAKQPTSRGKAISPSAAAPAEGRAAEPRAGQLGSSLFEEQRFIESARAAVARGDARGALSVLDAYDSAYARKQFGPEALGLRVEALSGSGQVAAARTLATDFARLYPSHPLLSRVQGAVQH